MKKSRAWLDLDENTLEAQRTARNGVKRDAIILISILVVGLILLLFGFRNIYLTFPFLFSIYVISNWRQWNVLITHNLHCPHCAQPLASRVKLYKSPSHNCPHCGKRALATIKQLKNKKGF